MKNTSAGKFLGMVVVMATLIPGWANASSISLEDFLTIDANNAGSAIFKGFCVIGNPPRSGNEASLVDIIVGITFDLDDDKVFFEFVNRSPFSANIAEIYFDDQKANPAYMGGGWVEAVLGTVSFTDAGDGGGASPGNLPGGNSLSPKFKANDDLSSEADGNSSTGVNTGENIVLGYDVYDWSALEAALLPTPPDLGLRIGMHIRSIGTSGESDSFYSCLDLPIPPETNTPNPPVPEPSTLVLLGMGSAFLALRKRRSV